jgi:hypothetical protein
MNVNDSVGFGHVERVRGGADARGCGFKGLFGETLVHGLFTNGSVPNTMPRIWLTSAPDNTALAGI